MNVDRTTKTAAKLSVALLCCLRDRPGQEVRYNAMPGTNFGKYHTYKWVSCGGQHPSQITVRRLCRTSMGEFSQKGFTKRASSDPVDMYVCYQIAVDQEKTRWNAYGMGGFRFGGMGTATSSTICKWNHDLEDMYDAAAKQQIWQGTATKTLEPSSNQEKNLKNLSKGIAKLMKNFPPPVKK